MARRVTIIATLALLTLALAAAPSSAAGVVNGNFQQGLTGWSVLTEDGSNGAWITYTGTSSSFGGGPYPSAIDGSSAISDQTGPMSSVLYQDVLLKSGYKHKLKFKYWYLNNDGQWSVPNPLTYSRLAFPNQQLVIDVLKGGAAPDSANASDVLATFLSTKPGDPIQVADWTDGQIDLSALAGQTVRLRFLNVNNQGNLRLGLDNVALESVDAVKPKVTGFKADPSRILRLGYGTNFRFGSSESAKASLTFKKCVKRGSKTTCSRVKGSLKGQAKKGANKIRFRGKLGGRWLATGSYRVTIVLTDSAGNKSVARTTNLTVLPASASNREAVAGSVDLAAGP